MNSGETERAERRLAAILAADVAGYSRLMGADEEGTLAALKRVRRELADPQIAGHHGRIVKTTGDGLLVEFASVVDAVRCAVEIQRGMAERNAAMPAGERIEFRIGINLGDIIIDEGDIFGDGVNVAARLEALAEPGGICVNRVVRDQVRDRLDIAFDDLGEQQVKNITRPVRVYRIGPPASGRPAPTLPSPAGGGGLGRGAGETPAVQPVLALPDKPSIAVLPFQNMSGDPEQEYFADGMVEEIITALSRIRWLFVIARNSTFTYKGQAVDVKQVGRDLGVRYVLEGSVRKGGKRVRIAAQLIEAETGAHLWADRFDGLIEDVFELQDKIAISVAGVIEPALQAAETTRSATRPTSDLTAYDLYLRAYKMLWSSGQIPEALRLFEQAIQRDPRYGPALAFAAFCRLRFCSDGFSADPDGDRRKGIDYARRALAVAGDDPIVLANGAQVLASFGEDIGAMIALIDRALRLNPSYARGWVASGYVRWLAGEPDLAIEHCKTAALLSPRARVGGVFHISGAAHLIAGRFEEAASILQLAIQDTPRFPHAYRLLAASYVCLGRLDDARKIVERLRAITPLVVEDFAYLRNPEHRELLASSLRLAAGETT